MPVISYLHSLNQPKLNHANGAFLTAGVITGLQHFKHLLRCDRPFFTFVQETLLSFSASQMWKLLYKNVNGKDTKKAFRSKYNFLRSRIQGHEETYSR